jgi:hypothetical protein
MLAAKPLTARGFPATASNTALQTIHARPELKAGKNTPFSGTETSGNPL